MIYFRQNMIDIEAQGKFILIIGKEKNSISGWQRNNRGGMT